MSVRSAGVCGPGGSWVVVGLVMAVLGCGKPPESGTVDVKGIVTLDGKPVDKASVAFIGKEGARLATAQTDSAGKFTIRAALGKNVVTVGKASASPTPPPQQSDGAQL